MLPNPSGALPVSPEIFHELTRSICPECRRSLDAKVVLRDNQVYLRRTCPEHGLFEARIYGDAAQYLELTRYNKPGAIPHRFSTATVHGCPDDCGLCPEHAQHVCVGIIEVNSACNMACPLCFANAGAGFNLTLPEVEAILDHLVATEGHPEVVQFSGGEPTIHPDLIAMIEAANRRDIGHVMINTNGRRIALDDAFLEELQRVRPSIYFQFDGFDRRTYERLRGEPDLLPLKLTALDRLASAGLSVVLVPAVERHVNEHEVGAIIRFGLDHPAVRGITFQPAFHAGRHDPHDPLERVTIPDVVRWIQEQTAGLFRREDFLPVPCCFPTCNAVSYAYVDEGGVTPLTRLINLEPYLDVVANRVLPDVSVEGLQQAVASLWSSAAVPGTTSLAQDFATACVACGLPPLGDLSGVADRMFMIMLQDFLDPWTFNQKTVMKCCKAVLLPDGRQIPFCAYNSVGYREQTRQHLAHRRRTTAPQPMTFGREVR
jgi:hypothetical protein